MFEIAITITTSVLSGLLLWFVKEYFKMRKTHEETAEKKLQEEIKNQKIRDDLLLGVARILLMDRMQRELDRGETTQAEYDVVEDLYDSYINSGGNGTVKHLFEDRYNKLKITH